MGSGNASSEAAPAPVEGNRGASGRTISLRPMDDLEREAERATELLGGLTVRVVKRHRPEEVMVEFCDGTRLYVDAEGEVELSRTEGGSDA